MLEGIEFTHKELLWLLSIIPVLLLWYILKHKKQTAVLEISSTDGLLKGNQFWPILKHSLFVLRALALTLIIVAMARPQTVYV